VERTAALRGPPQLRATPSGHAMKFLLTVVRIDTVETFRIGLSGLWPSAEYIERTAGFRGPDCEKRPASPLTTKHSSRQTKMLSKSAAADLIEMAFGILNDTNGLVEGRRAFAEKRAPRFEGR